MGHLRGLFSAVVLAGSVYCGNAWATDPAELERFITARIEIGEMMTEYFKHGGYGEGGRPSGEQMQSMRTDINSKLGSLLEKHGLTIDEYRGRSKEIFADEEGIKQFLGNHPDLKERYDALPFDRMGRGGGGSGRGY